MGITLKQLKQMTERKGNNLSEFFYIKEGEKKRIRVRHKGMQDFLRINAHKWSENNHNNIFVCKKEYGEHCELCDEGKPVYMYLAGTVYDYDRGERKIMFEKSAKQYSPIDSLIDIQEDEENQEIDSMDYLVKQTGRGLDKSITVKSTGSGPTVFSGNAPAYKESDVKQKIKDAYWYVPKGDVPNEEEEPVKKTSVYDHMNEIQLWQELTKRGVTAEPTLGSEKYIEMLEDMDKIAEESGSLDEELPFNSPISE